LLYVACYMLYVKIMYRIFRQIHNQVKKSDKILLIPHTNPDGDALGSLTAFIQFLSSIDKKYHAFCSSEIPERLKTLPHTEQISSNTRIWDNFDFDLIIVFDTGDLQRAGIDEHLKKLPKKPSIINFDHHHTNDYFGDLNIVMVNFSSTAEVVYNFFKHNDIAIDSTMATCLLAGFLTDTDFFTNGATTIESLNITSKLIRCGGDTKLTKESMFKNKTIDTLKLWGLLFSRLKKHNELDVVYTYITQKDLKKYSVSEEATEGISNFMNNINESKACLIFKEIENNKVKGSFRTTHNDVDVAQISKKLGGGGHKKAAGFTIDGPLKKAAKEVFDAVKSFEQLNIV